MTLTRCRDLGAMLLLSVALVTSAAGHGSRATGVTSDGPYGVAMALMYYAPRDNVTIGRIANAAKSLGGPFCVDALTPPLPRGPLHSRRTHLRTHRASGSQPEHGSQAHLTFFCCFVWPCCVSRWIQLESCRQCACCHLPHLEPIKAVNNKEWTSSHGAVWTVTSLGCCITAPSKLASSMRLTWSLCKPLFGLVAWQVPLGLH